MATRPQRGGLAIAAAETPAQIEKRRSNSGEWRPDVPFAGEGLAVTLRAVRGVTVPGVLAVPFRFQVPPIGEFSRKWAFEWSRYSTLRVGERARPGGRKLFEHNFDTIFVDGPTQDDDRDSYIIWDGAPEPQRLIRELRYIMGDTAENEASPFRLTISQASVWPDEWLVNVYAVITDLQATERPGEIGTEYISISVLEVPSTSVDRRRQPRAEEKTRKHKINRGRDDLYEIAKRYYRDPALWRLIQKANGIKGVSPGSEAELEKWAKKHKRRELKIPPKPTDDGNASS